MAAEAVVNALAMKLGAVRIVVVCEPSPSLRAARASPVGRIALHSACSARRNPLARDTGLEEIGVRQIRAARVLGITAEQQRLPYHMVLMPPQYQRLDQITKHV